MRKLLFIALAALLPAQCANAQDAVKCRWGAREISDTWRYSHQDTATVKQVWVEDGLLCVKTRACTYDRTKMSTPMIYTSGTYRWKTYIPEFGPGDKTSVGSWIYCDDHHEVDFEVGWGTTEKRLEAGCGDGEVLACMTNQDFPFTSSYVPISIGWHEFEIRLDVVDGRYLVHWVIDGSERKSQLVGFGPETSFRIFVSVENLNFIGDHIASKDNVGKYEWVTFDGQISLK